MDVEEGEANLCEPFEYLWFWDVRFGLFGVFDSLSEVALGCVLHDDVEFHPEGAVDLFEADYVQVVQHLQDLGLFLGSLLLLGRQVGQVDLLDHPLLAGEAVLDQEGATVGTAA